jgi:FMN phosphatase YigB (HAD superfamily)
MALTLEQYAAHLDSRDVTWPAPPTVERPKARPHLTPLPEVRVVTWSVYGSLLAISGGELLFEHPQKFIMEVALDKTLQEFKMWGSMSRKPGQPAEYLTQLYNKALEEQRSMPSPGEKHPELLADRAWENILKKLLQKDYKFDAGYYGSLNEYSRKVAYFFHASLQGLTAYEGAAAALQELHGRGVKLGAVADGQCFSPVQLQRSLAAQDAGVRVDTLFDDELCVWSYQHRARKPSERLFRELLSVLEQRGVEPGQVLHIGPRLTHDVAPARRLGLRTALFAGDKGSLQATGEQLKDPATRPDVLLTELSQITEVVPGG